MKLSKRTLQVLKNFSSINQSVVFHPGNVIKTVVPGNTQDFFGTSPVEEEFAVECAIYDIRRFLSCLELFEDPDITFNATHALITDGKNTIRYQYVDKDIIDHPDYSKTPRVKNRIVEFTITAEQIKTLIKASTLLSVKDVKITGSTDGTIRVNAADAEIDADSFDMVVATDVDFDTPCSFTSLYSVDKLRLLIEDDYTISIANNVMTEFRGSSGVVYHHGGFIEVQ